MLDVSATEPACFAHSIKHSWPWVKGVLYWFIPPIELQIERVRNISKCVPAVGVLDGVANKVKGKSRDEGVNKKREERKLE